MTGETEGNEATALKEFEAFARELTRKRGERVCLVFVAVFAIALAVGQLVARQPSVPGRIWVPAQMASSALCWLALRYAPISRRFPTEVAAFFQWGIAGFGGLLLGRMGDLDGPFFYAIYALPPLVLGMPCSLRERVLLTMSIIGPFCIGYFGPNPEYLAHPFIHIPIMYVLTIVIVSIAVGHWVYNLLRDRYMLTLRVERQAARLAASNRVLSQEVVKKSGDLRRLSGKLDAIRMDERADIARDLHDDLGQLIVGARIELANLQRSFGSSPPENLDALERIVENLSDASRRIVGDLRTQSESTIEEDISALVAPLRDRLALRIDTAFDCPEPVPSPVREVALRIVQEALTNTLKHARASRIEVSARAKRETLEVSIVDDGDGFDPDAVHEGFGLIGMRERAERAHGSLSISSSRLGSAVRMTLPMDQLS